MASPRPEAEVDASVVSRLLHTLEDMEPSLDVDGPWWEQLDEDY